MRLKNRFAELLAAHERKTGRKWTYEEISSATGISTSTLSAYALNKVKRFDAVTVEPMLRFFNCGIDDLLVLMEEDEQGQEVAVVVG